MEVVALCPFSVGTLVWRSPRGDWTLTTCVKATFRLEHGRDLGLHPTQDPVSGERRFGDAEHASLQAPGDLVPFKPRADVCLVGHAFAPTGQAVEALVARLSVGEVDKAIGLIGNRTWKEGPDGFEPSAPEPFTKMPLRYERAARAPDNPVGLDLAAAPTAGALALPNLEPVEDDPGGHIIGFGPIAPEWQPRRELLGGHAPPQAGTQVPEGFDFGFFNASPRDQQVDLLRANARVVLENLHPRHARLETRIPAVKPKAFFVDSAGRANEIALRCDTVWIDTDRGVLALTWRGLCTVEGGDDPPGTLVVAVESRGKEIRYKQIEALMREGTLGSLGTDDLATDEPNPMGVRHDSVRPDAPTPPTLSPRSAADRPPRRDRQRDSDPSRTAAAGGASAEARRDGSSPGASATGGASPPPGSSPPAAADDERRAAGAAVAPPDSAARRPDDSTRTDVATGPPAIPDAPVSISAETTSITHTRDEALAPLATKEATIGEADEASGSAGWRDVSGHEASSDALETDLDRYAGIAAELAESPTDTGEVLATHGLDRAQWNELERRWTRTAEVAAAGSTTDRFVAAFERARERVRLVAAIKLGEYLRVLTAVARGEPAPALAELSLEPDDLPLLQRTWARRAGRDPEVAKLIAETDDAGRDPASRSVTATSTLTTTTGVAGAATDPSTVAPERAAQPAPPVPSPPDSATGDGEPSAASATPPAAAPPPAAPGAPATQKPIKKRR
ncbi:MAG: DUF2169 domain-containing protein [Polyangiaceae bacterium]